MSMMVLIKPLLTEKTVKQAAMGKYTFVVDRAAAKTQIQTAVEQQFDVEVASITTSLTHPKTRRAGRRRTTFLTRELKKAIVTLKKGSIDLFAMETVE